MKYSLLFIDKGKVYCCALLLIMSSVNPLFAQNNSCANAAVIVPSILPQCQNSPINGGNPLESETELWYKFTATSTGHTLIFTDDFYPFGFCDPTITLYQGTCEALQSFLQIQTTPNELIDTTINSLTVGSDYWIQIICSSYLSIEFCLGTLPINYNCTGAVQIPTSVEVPCYYTTSVATPDTWYKFEATASNYKIHMKSEWSQIFTVEVIEGGCGLNQLVIGTDSSEFIASQVLTYWQESNLLITDLTPGQTYYIKIINATYYIDLCLYPAPINDECTYALEIPLLGPGSACNPVSINTGCATQSFNNLSCAEPGLDVWYYIQPSLSNIQIQAFKSYYEIDSSIRVVLYSEFFCDNAIPNEIDCATGGDVLTAPVTAGEKYYVRIISDVPQDLKLCIQYLIIDAVPESIWTIDTVAHVVYTLDNNVGINTSNPERSLDVLGQVRIDYQPESGSSQALQVLGNVSISGELTTDSDIRYKRSIRPLHSALDRLQKLAPVIYNYNTDKFPERHFPDREKMGLLAQDVEKIFPNIITTDQNGYKSVNYTELIPLLIQAIKEQQVEIEELKKR